MRNLLITGTIVFALLLAACNSDEDSEYAVKSDVGNITKDEFYEELVALDNGNLLQQLILEMVLKDKYSVDEKEVEDRKSSRLNSSHVAISYAVFCLKKKKR